MKFRFLVEAQRSLMNPRYCRSHIVHFEMSVSQIYSISVPSDSVIQGERWMEWIHRESVERTDLSTEQCPGVPTECLYLVPTSNFLDLYTVLLRINIVFEYPSIVGIFHPLISLIVLVIAHAVDQSTSCLMSAMPLRHCP